MKGCPTHCWSENTPPKFCKQCGSGFERKCWRIDGFGERIAPDGLFDFHTLIVRVNCLYNCNYKTQVPQVALTLDNATNPDSYILLWTQEVCPSLMEDLYYFVGQSIIPGLRFLTLESAHFKAFENSL